MKGKRVYRIGCSKKIASVAWVLFGILLSAFLYGFFCTEKDMTAFAIILGGDSAVTGAATGFYFWKAKAEKKLELFERMAERWEDEYGIEAVTTLAQTIFSE